MTRYIFAQIVTYGWTWSLRFHNSVHIRFTEYKIESKMKIERIKVERFMQGYKICQIRKILVTMVTSKKKPLHFFENRSLSDFIVISWKFLPKKRHSKVFILELTTVPFKLWFFTENQLMQFISMLMCHYSLFLEKNRQKSLGFVLYTKKLFQSRVKWWTAEKRC